MMFKPRPKGLGKDAFLKLADGEEVTGIFRGEIITFKKHWLGKGMGGGECTGADCPICLQDPEKGPAFRFRVNFITTKEGAWVAKIFEGGGKLYDQLVAIDKKFNLADTVVDITRSGTDKNTNYNVLPRKDVPITKEMKAKIDAVVALPLKAEDVQA